jgi:cell wall-associated NlpC family hydrolase
MNRRLRSYGLIGIALIGLTGLVIGCGVGGLTAGRPPRWACPSPTPEPWGPGGPIKDQIPLPTAAPSGPQSYENVYFAEWEQEYAALGGPPFPSPTPYSVVGLNYVLGQRVEVWPLHVMVSARSGDVVTLPGVAPNTQQLYYVDITWYNHAAEAIPITYAERVRVRSVTAPNGAIVTDSNWGLNHESMTVAGMTAPPDTIPPGESQVSIPIIAPVGEVKTVEITFVGQPGYTPLMPTATTLAGTPTATPLPTAPPATPTPNIDLQASAANEIAVTWTNTRLDIGPACGDPGAMTNWDDSSAWGHDAALAIPAPPGAGRLVQIALNQVGKPYVWGAKGPEQFDCSGLSQWSYAQIGIHIPTGTAGQWPQMRPLGPGALQPGDLIFFDVAMDGQISHVGMLIGDLNGDGTWDMVHAATPKLGVRVEYDVFGSPFWRPRIAGFRTAR